LGASKYRHIIAPETYFASQPWTSDVREVVERFYAAASSRDQVAIAELIDERFDPAAVVREPEWQPFGGVYEGAQAIKALYAELCSSASSIDFGQLTVEEVIEAVSESDKIDHIVVSFSFPTSSAERGHALQWWTFKNLRVAEVRTFYWGTAASGVS
jgi:hypothetical protein